MVGNMEKWWLLKGKLFDKGPPSFFFRGCMSNLIQGVSQTKSCTLHERISFLQAVSRGSGHPGSRTASFHGFTVDAVQSQILSCHSAG